ncbi:MAG TPA: arsenate reductase (glutaredoxin) [Sulfuricaulis sp.]|nr:arsenate reductase (glutaredoxin) [Sulfuricaulis sp.]
MTRRTSGASRASVKPVTIYHNPRCTKSRQTLALLEQRGIKPKVIEYLVTPPTEAELKRLLKLLGITPRELLRTKEDEYKQAKLDRPDVTDAEIVRAMVKYPRLIERPIVVSGNKAALGRPPENVLKII